MDPRPLYKLSPYFINSIRWYLWAFSEPGCSDYCTDHLHPLRSFEANVCGRCGCDTCIDTRNGCMKCGEEVSLGP